MSEYPDQTKNTEELKKLANVVTDMAFDSKMRNQAINQICEIGTHEALLVLLNIAANDKMHIDERELALKRAREIVKKGR